MYSNCINNEKDSDKTQQTNLLAGVSGTSVDVSSILHVSVPGSTAPKDYKDTSKINLEML